MSEPQQCQKFPGYRCSEVEPAECMICLEIPERKKHMTRRTHTYVTLHIPQPVYDSIRTTLEKGGYADQIMDDGLISMQGIAVKSIAAPMTPQEYVHAALHTEMSFKDYHLVAERLQDVNAARLLHHVMGLVTEAGELMDVLKRYLIYGKPIDWQHVIEEIGDSQWYTAGAVDVCGEVVPGTTWESIWDANIAKLKARYPDRFSEQAALNRDTGKERAALEGIRFHELPSSDCGDVMTAESMLESVRKGAFNDNDGHGYLATQNQESEVLFVPSTLMAKLKHHPWASHVTWYNK